MERYPNSQKDECQMYNPKSHNDFFFAPSSQFKVMVNRRHFKYSSSQKISSADLYQDTGCFHVKHESQECEYGDMVYDNGVYREQRA